jgi:hypothetical protein
MGNMVDWSIDGKDKRKIFYVRNMNGILSVLMRKNLKINAVTAGLKGRTFPFDIGRPAFRNKNTFYYIVDVEKGQINFNTDIKPPVAPELWDAVMNRHIIKDLVSSLESPEIWASLLYIILALVAGLGLGAVLGMKLL